MVLVICRSLFNARRSKPLLPVTEPAKFTTQQLKHDRGVVDAPGLYVLGLPYLRRRKSSFMPGAEDDVRELGTHLTAHLGEPLERATTQVQVTFAA